jgi:hypothetical protein
MALCRGDAVSHHALDTACPTFSGVLSESEALVADDQG